MKNLKLILLLVIFYSMTYGQDSKFAVCIELAPTLTQLKGNFKPPIDFNGIDPRDATITWSSQFGFKAGLSFEYFINKRYSLKSGLAYQRKSAKNYSVYPTDDPADYFISDNNFIRMDFDYLTLPVMGSFSTKGKIKFYIDGGVYFGFLLRQQDIYHIESQSKTIVNNTYQFKRLDLGLSLGLGLRIPLSNKLLLEFGLYNNNGLININKNYLRTDVVLRTGSNGLQIGLKYCI